MRSRWDIAKIKYHLMNYNIFAMIQIKYQGDLPLSLSLVTPIKPLWLVEGGSYLQTYFKKYCSCRLLIWLLIWFCNRNHIIGSRNINKYYIYLMKMDKDIVHAKSINNIFCYIWKTNPYIMSYCLFLSRQCCFSSYIATLAPKELAISPVNIRTQDVFL